MKRTYPSAPFSSLKLALALCLTAPSLGSLALAQQNGSSAADRASQKVAPANSPAVLCGLTLANSSAGANSGKGTANASKPGDTSRSGSVKSNGQKEMDPLGDHSSHSAGQGSSGSTEAASQGVAAGKKVTGTDLCFVQQAATSDLFEIGSSRLAAGQASSGKVKALAAHLIQDHTQASAKLAALAPRLGITLPGTLPAPRLAEVTALRAQKGAGFDRAYAAAQVTAHEQAVNLFSAYLQAGGHPLLQAHAKQTLPALKKHLQTARDLLKSLSGAKS